MEKIIKELESLKLSNTGFRAGSYNEGIDAALHLIKSSLPKPVEVPEEIRGWFVNALGNENKFNGTEVLEILQEVAEEEDGLNHRSFYGIDCRIACYATNNSDIFLKLLVNCSKNDGYTVVKEPDY